MTKPLFLALGLALLCAMPILGTFAQDGETPARTARLSAPSLVQTAPVLY